MINTAMKRTFEDKGYCLERNVVPGNIIKAARARVDEIMEDTPDWAERSWQVIDPARKQNAQGRPLPLGIQKPARFDPVFDSVVRHPNLIASMTALLDGEVELFTDQIGVKQGFITEEQGGRTYYHQDSYYWKIEPGLGINCWIPLDDVGVDAIALGIKPGSHRDWTLHSHERYQDDPAWGHMRQGKFTPLRRLRVPLADIDYSDEIVFPMQPGDGLYFTNYTWHRSEPNRTGETRMYYAIAYRLTEPSIAERNIG